MYYLGLPEDKIGIGEALKNVIEQGAKPNNVLKKGNNNTRNREDLKVILLRKKRDRRLFLVVILAILNCISAWFCFC